MLGVFRALMTTLSTASRSPVTRQYPEVHTPIPERERAFPLLLWDQNVNDRSAPAARRVSARALSSA